jgi:hypothetical protein
LSTVCAELESACMTGTPLRMPSAKLRAKRAIAALCTILPAIGSAADGDPIA